VPDVSRRTLRSKERIINAGSFAVAPSARCATPASGTGRTVSAVMRVIGAGAPESIVELRACHPVVAPPLMAIGEGGLGV